MTEVFIAGVGMTTFGRRFERTYQDLTREALEHHTSPSLGISSGK